LREHRRQRGTDTITGARATINRQVDRPTTATDVCVDVEDVDDEEGTNKRGLPETLRWPEPNERASARQPSVKLPNLERGP
jgi:hypothetical protein